jgi:Family of unknown function (DUF6152)
VIDEPVRKLVLKVLSVMAVAACAAGYAGVAFAHHSFAVFDSARSLSVKGTVKEVQWTNPHVWVQVVVVDGAGVSREYAFEGGAIAVLKRMGWTRDTLKAGDIVSISGHPFRNEKLGGSLDQVTLPNGKTMSAGNGIPGALVVGGGAP